MSNADKPVIVKFADGATYGVASVAVAKRVYPTAEIVGYQDGSPYEAPKPKPKRVRKSRAKTPTTPAATPEGEGNGDPD